MQRNEIEPRVIKCVADSLAIEPDDITTHSLLISELGADSLDFMDIMFHIEDEFKIKMQREELDFLSRIELTREKAVVDGLLTGEAKQRLTRWMPGLPVDKELKPADLSYLLTIESMTIMIETALSEHEAA